MRSSTNKVYEKLRYWYFVIFFCLQLISHRYKDGGAMLKSRGYITSLRVMVLWAKKQALQKIKVKYLAYDYKYTRDHFQPEILFITSDSTSPSHVYRIDNHIYNFRKLGIACSWINQNEAELILEVMRQARVIYLWRMGFNGDEVWLKSVLASSKIVIYDTDDLTFEKESYNTSNVDGLNFVSQNTRRHLTGKFIEQQVDLITKVDMAIGSTNRIVKGFQKFGGTAFLLPNFAPSYMKSEEISLLIKNSVPRRKIIGYASGSNTHRKDFEVVLPALFKVLSENYDWTFECLGFLPFDKKLIPDNLTDRIFMRDLVNQEQLLNEMKMWDIVLAPVETENPFTESKSALKYIHASLVGAVTVASPTQPFQEIILDNIDGFLASTTGEWLSYLQRLILDEEYLKTTSNLAFKKVSEEHLISTQIPIYADLLEKIYSIEKVSDSKSNSKKRVLLLLNDNLLFSGGTRMALRLLTSLKSDVEYKYTFLDKYPKSKIEEFANHYDLLIENFVEEIEIEKYDKVIATFWRTAEYLASINIDIQKVLYLVQDFEPLFYPLNENFMRALATYKNYAQSLLVLGNWNTGILRELLDIQPRFELDLPVDLVKYVNKGSNFDYDCLFFTRDNSDRRLPSLVLETINMLSLMNPDLRIAVFGTSNLQYSCSGRVELLGEVSASDLPDIYSRSKLGIAFSPTNTSRIPLEMAACGLPVVDIEGILQNLRYFPEFPVAYSSPNAHSLVRTISQIMSNIDELAAMRAKAHNFRTSLISEEDFDMKMSEIWDEILTKGDLLPA